MPLSSSGTTLKILNIIGFIVLLVLLAFSFGFYLERTCFSDIAFQTFHIINSKSTFVQVHRFGSAIIHWFPLAGVILKLPLKSILMLYSISFVVENIALFLLLWKWLKQKEVALILALFNVLLVSETFYWTTSEIKQGMSFGIFFFGFIRAYPLSAYSGIKKIWLLIATAVLAVTVLFLHPLMIILLVFILGYVWLENNIASKTILLFSFTCIATGLAVKYIVLPIPGYDSGKYGTVQYFVSHFPHYLSLPSFVRFWKYLVKDWYLFALIFLSVSAYMVYSKQWLKLLWVGGFSFAYLFLINVTHPDGADKFYIESFYLMLGIFVLFPLVLEMLPRVKPSYAIVIIVSVFALRLNTIYHIHKPYSERISWVRAMMKKHDGKFIVSEYHVPVKKLRLTWGVPYESLLLSSIASPDSARSFIVLEDVYGYYSQFNEAENYLFGAFNGIHAYDDLNRNYFNPVKGKYRILPEGEVVEY